MNEHLRQLVERVPALEPCAPDIERAYSALCDCYAAGGKALACGNGGSSAAIGIDARVEIGPWQIRSFLASQDGLVREVDLLERTV